MQNDSTTDRPDKCVCGIAFTECMEWRENATVRQGCCTNCQHV